MTRSRWALAPGGRVAHRWYPLYESTMAPGERWNSMLCDDGAGSSAYLGRELRPPGKARRCKRCLKAK